MAKRRKQYTEAELIYLLKLNRIIETQTQCMQEWLKVTIPVLTASESALFEEIYKEALVSIQSWSEEDLKMKFITDVLRLGNIKRGERFITCFEKTIEAEVDGHFLKIKTDFMVASGILDLPMHPYFHFQEYKPHKKPTGDSMAQLLEAMLIAQALNKNEKPIYGCEIIGRQWSFVTLEGKSYCISKTFDCTDKEDLLKIIAILRKFRHILETELLDEND